MKLVSFSCPGCGARLNVDADLKQATCQFCGSTFPVDDEALHMKIDGAEQAGYEFEKGRQRAQQEQAGPQTVYVQVQAQQPKPKRKTWLWVLGWICIFPVPLTIIMLKNESVKEKLNPKARYVIIAIAWLLYLCIGVFGGGGSNNSKVSESTSSTSPAVVQASSDSASSSATEFTASSGESATSAKVEPLELDELQKAFCSLNDGTTRDDINALIAENRFEVTKFTGDSAYYIGYEYKAIDKRGRDREGEALDINFDNDGRVKSAEYTVHTGFSTHTALKYESGEFYYEGNKAESGESAMQEYLATQPKDATRATSSSNNEDTTTYAEDSVVNDFIVAYNAISGSPIESVSKGNIRTKYFGYSYGYYLQLLHANNTGKISIDINETNENADVGVPGMRDVFHDAAKTIDPSLSDDDIYGYFDAAVENPSNRGDGQLGSIAVFYSADVDLSSGHSRGYIRLSAQ